MFTSTTAHNHEQYIAMVEEPKRSELQQLHDMISRSLPGYEQWITSGIMGFGKFHYKGKSKACEGEWFHVGLVANKSGMSLYMCVGDEGGYLPEQAKDRIGKATVGRSCIRFKKLSDINLDVLQELLDRVKELKTMF